MGKTTPSITQLILDTIEETKPLYEGLPAADQLRMDVMFKRVAKYKVAISNAKPLRPVIVLCILMLLEVYKMNNELHHAQYEEIKRLRKALEAAGLITEQEPGQIEDESSKLLEMVDQLKIATLAS